MNTNIIYPHGLESVAVPASSKIAVKAIGGEVQVFELAGGANVPEKRRLLQTVSNGEWVSDAFSAATTVEIEANEAEVHFSVGTAPSVLVEGGANIQEDPGALNATGALTAALILGKIVTSTTAAAASFDVNDSFDFSVINTGPSAFTVTAATGHTVVGDGAVATGTSGIFRTRKTAADTFVTYRIG